MESADFLPVCLFAARIYSGPSTILCTVIGTGNSGDTERRQTRKEAHGQTMCAVTEPRSNNTCTTMGTVLEEQERRTTTERSYTFTDGYLLQKGRRDRDELGGQTLAPNGYDEATQHDTPFAEC